MPRFLVLTICWLALFANSFAQEWGKLATNGLQTSLKSIETPRAYGAYRFELTLRNTDGKAVELPPADQVVAWLFVAQGRTAFFSARTNPDAKSWPRKLATGATVTMPLDLGEAEMFRFGGGMRIANGYPKPAEGKPIAAGPMNKALEFGKKATMSWILLFPGNPIISVGSNKLVFDVDRPDWDKLPQKDRNVILDRLVAGYLKGAVSAKATHPMAVMLGAPALDALAAALQNPKTKADSKAWLIASICEIGGEKAAQAIVNVLAEPKPWVGTAYHCARISDPRIDVAVLKHAMVAGNEEFAVWAIRGYTTFRKRAPAALVQFAVKSKDSKLKNYGIIALGKQPTADELKQLLMFLKSDDARTQASTATALKNSRRRTQAVVGALVDALPKAKPFAQERICDALNTLSGNRGIHVYNAEKPEASVKYWTQWWFNVKDNFEKGN